VTAFGKFFYSDQNVRSQGAYALTNFRAGLRAWNWSIEAWVRNAFDENYVQVAIPFSLVRSGFIGEPGAPKTMGVSVGFRF
jgi:outer membrane receptor protein involved in Fe transport